jgi:flagellin-like hook-associated protein FlgL
MLTGSALNVTYDRIAAFYKINQNRMTDSMVKAASGSRFLNPSDAIPDYFHSQKLKNQSTRYTEIRQNIADGSGLIDVATAGGQYVFDSISKMKDLVKMYYDTSDNDEKKGFKAEFNQLASNVLNTISTTVYDGKKLISDSSASPLKSISLEPDSNQMFTISFTSAQVADTSGLTLGTTDEQTEADAAQAELDKAGSYLAQVSAYSMGIKAQYSLVSTKISTYQALRSDISDADMGQETTDAVNRSIREQSAIAMMSQTNMARSFVLRLLRY